MLQHSSPNAQKRPNLPGQTEEGSLLADFLRVRRGTEAICEPLCNEDHVVQTAPEVSPPKWHLAHTTWFFEKFIARTFLPGYVALNDSYDRLFNSYYQSVGNPWPR